MRNITWEKTKDEIGVDLLQSDQVRGNPALLRTIAIAKLNSVNLIGANFNDTQIVYGRWITVLIQERNICTFWGVYLSSDFDESICDKESMPNLCMRKAVWDRQTDLSLFMNATDKHEYVYQQQLIMSDILFAQHVNIHRFYQTAIDFAQKCEQGINISAGKSLKPSWEDIGVSVFGNFGRIEVNYCPQLANVTPLSQILGPWLDQFSDVLQDCTQTLPSRITASYDPSVLDLISRIRS